MARHSFIHLLLKLHSALRRHKMKSLFLEEVLRQPVDKTPRLLLFSAFSTEWKALLSHARVDRTMSLLGRSLVTGEMGGCQVAITVSGASMVNAAMVTQAALERFNIRGIVMCGVAGGANPSLHIGDVTVPGRWGQYQEHVMAPEKGQEFDAGWFSSDFGHYGMMFPQPLTITRKEGRASSVEKKFWFECDSDMLETARQMQQQVKLKDRGLFFQRLPQKPRLVIGGSGVSGPSFVNNADYRQWIWQTFQADAIDMESAAVAHVACINHVPFISFRTLSDLAGGSKGNSSDFLLFASLAAENSAAVVSAFLQEWSQAG